MSATHESFSNSTVHYLFLVLLSSNCVCHYIYRNKTEVCGSYQVSSNGYIDSPGFPDGYPPNLDCHWTIQATEIDSIFNVTSVFFFVEYQEECVWDRVIIRDGQDNSNIKHTYCGNHPINFVSQDDVIHIDFHSDLSNSDVGFRIRYEEISDDDKAQSKSFGAINNFLMQNTPHPTASTTASNSRGQSEGNEDDKAESKSFGAINNLFLQNTPHPTASTTARNSRGLSEGNEDCYQEIRTSNGNISSPNYPGQYPVNKVCVTVLRNEVVSSYVIEFLKFDIEASENCSYDSVNIVATHISSRNERTANSSNQEYRFCGLGPENGLMTLKGSEVKITFTSDMSINRLGFFGNFFAVPEYKDLECQTPCANGGTCIIEPQKSGIPETSCKCAKDFDGKYCERWNVTCHSVTCHHGGTCAFDTKESDVKCICKSGFTGDRCQNITLSSETLSFTKFPGNLSMTLNSRLLLECAVNDPDADVMWLYRDHILMESDKKSGMVVLPDGVVYINNFRELHTGRYTCLAVTATDLLERSIWLTVKESCLLEAEKYPQNITVQEGEAAIFQCHVQSADVIAWRKDGSAVVQDHRKRVLVNNYLIIENVMEADKGEYTCAARNTRNGCYARLSAILAVKTISHANDCGIPQVSAFDYRNYRVSGGREAAENSAPWHIIIRETIHNTAFCGGSLLTDHWVLTAAHCVYQFPKTYHYPFDTRHIHLFLGTNHCEGRNGIERSVKSYIIHPNFDGSNFDNDLALFELNEQVTFSERIMPICLERSTLIKQILQEGMLGIVTGCGNLHENGRAPMFLNEIRLPYVSREKCAESASSVNANFTDGMMCAGYSRNMRGDACAGDSGGPYVMQFAGRFVLVGIVSWGVGCDREDQYGYYTDVSRYYDWIMETVSSES